MRQHEWRWLKNLPVKNRLVKLPKPPASFGLVSEILPAPAGRWLEAGAEPKENNRLRLDDRAAHQWYRFILSFPPHLVRTYAGKFNLDAGHRVLDPFCGTGTTVVECKKLGISAFGLEPNPIACFASRTKLSWKVDPEGLWQHAQLIAQATIQQLEKDGISEEEGLPLFALPARDQTVLRQLDPAVMDLLLSDSISPLPLHKTLVLLDMLERHRDERFHDHERLALAASLVNGISNLHFGPEVGVGQPKADSPVVSLWLKAIREMAADLGQLQNSCLTDATVYQADAREVARTLPPESVDAVITSPPYPNEKDYTRTTRLESVLLGFIQSKQDLRALKQQLVRSNTRSVYKADTDDFLVNDHSEIQRIAAAIEHRRIELNKDSGFERLYARVTKLYFGGMKRHLAELRPVLRPGAQLAYVVGDQASYLRVMIRTGQILADIAVSLGYEVTGIDLFRTRLATATREQLREEVVLLRWPGTLATHSKRR